jgi:HK97 family phage portal protein
VSLLFGGQRRAGSPFPEPTVSPYPGSPSSSGAPVTADSAMRVSTVWACVRLLADSVSMMPLHAYTVRQGVRTPIDDPPLLVSPAAGVSTPDWVYMVMVSLLLRGNAYGLIVSRDAMGYATQIELLPPDTVSVRLDAFGQVTYSVRGVAKPFADVWHVSAYRTPGSLVGLSPISYAASAIGTQTAVDAFAKGYFEDAPHPVAVVSTDGPVNQDQARQVKDRITASWQGREIAVLGSGAKYTPIAVSPEESQFLETKRYGVPDIARFFGVAPEMIGGSSGNAMTYANVTQRAMDFLTYSVQPWLTRIEAALYPLLPGKKHVRFDTSVLVRLDASTRWNVNKIRLMTGAETINGIRAEEDQPAVSWGDEPFLPGMAPAAAANDVALEGAQSDGSAT